MRKVMAVASAALIAMLGVGLTSTSADAATCKSVDYKDTTSGKVVNYGCQAVQVQLYRYWGGGGSQTWTGPARSDYSYASTGGAAVQIWYARGELGGSWSGWVSY